VCVEGLPAGVCGGLARRCLWRACPPVFVEGLPAGVCGGLARLCLWLVYPPTDNR